MSVNSVGASITYCPRLKLVLVIVTMKANHSAPALPQKSAYEATATGANSAGSRPGSGGGGSPVGGGITPKEEVNVSLQRLVSGGPYTLSC